MDELSPLGPAAVSADDLTGMVAASYAVAGEHVQLCDVRVEPVAYAWPAITTVGRHWVRGTAQVCGTPRPFAFFVKVVQSWGRTPLFATIDIPEELRQWAIASVPWRTEPLVYRSDLRDRLPDGLSMPTAYAVHDLPDESASLWLEAVPVVEVDWDAGRYAEAAHLVGRLASSSRVAELAEVGRHDFTVADYYRGRIVHQVLPMLRDEGIWGHPLVAGAFDDALRDRLRAAADASPAWIEELLALPLLTAHGDACPNNLLVRPDRPGFTLIDFGFWHAMPAGYDLGQLLVGDVQIGRRPAGDLAGMDDALVTAYVEGLRAEGCAIPLDVVRRGHALSLALFTGLSSLPWEHLDADPTPELRAMAADRAAIASYALDLVDATA